VVFSLTEENRLVWCLVWQKRTD